MSSAARKADTSRAWAAGVRKREVGMRREERATPRPTEPCLALMGAVAA